jgi:probable blue pigment (indigoidine) exporter
MEASVRWVGVTAIAPIAWGSNYYVTRQFLPADYPLWGAALRALPAGLALLLWRRSRPRGDWWWKAAVLGVLNVGAFFVLIYLAAQRLPTSVAAMIMALAPVAMMALAAALLSERPATRTVTGALVGIGGVAIMLSGRGGGVDGWGVIASVTAMTMSSVGFVLSKRWSTGIDVRDSTAWQLAAGGILLLPVAVVGEGRPPHLDAGAVLGFAYVTVIATALAFIAWFAGLRHLPAATVGLIGLLNPVTGVLLGCAVAGESLTLTQAAGIALVLVGIAGGRPRSSTGRRRPPARASQAGPPVPHERSELGRFVHREVGIRRH